MSRVLDGHVSIGEIFGRTYTAAMLIDDLDAAGIDAACVSPDPAGLATDHEQATDMLLQAAADHPSRILPYAVASAWRGAEAVVLLNRALDAGCVAVKVDPMRQGHLLLDPVLTPVLGLAEERQVPVYVATGTAFSLPLHLAALARQWPRVNFIAGRTGRPDFARDAPYMLRAAQNIYADTAHDAPDLWMPAILEAATVWRVIFASDTPMAIPGRELRISERMCQRDEDREALLGGNLRRLLNLSQAEPDRRQP